MEDSDRRDDARTVEACSDHLMSTIDELARALRDENTALAGGDTAAASVAAERKAALARVYEQYSQAIQAGGAVLDGLTPEQVDGLREAIEYLKDLSVKNARLVNAMMQASSALLDAIIASAKNQEGSAAVYGRSGRINNRLGGVAANVLTFDSNC